MYNSTFSAIVIEVLCMCSDLDRVNVLAEEMAELVSIEAQRQACWAVLKHGTGAQLLCPTSGSVLTRDDLIGKLLHFSNTWNMSKVPALHRKQ